MIRSHSTAVVVAALTALATLVAPAAQSDEALLIRNATVYTGITGAATQAATDVIVQDGRIAALGKGLAKSRPKNNFPQRRWQHRKGQRRRWRRRAALYSAPHPSWRQAPPNEPR